MAESEKLSTKVIKMLEVAVVSVDGIENEATLEEHVSLIITLGETQKHVIDLQNLETFQLPEQNKCSFKFEVSFSDVIGEDDKLIFTLEKEKPKTLKQLIFGSFNYIYRQLSSDVENQTDYVIGTAEVNVKLISMSDSSNFQMTLHFKTATIKVILSWAESKVPAAIDDGEPTYAEPSEKNFLDIELGDLKDYFWPKSKNVLDKDTEERSNVKVLDDRCVVPYLMTKFTEIGKKPLNHIREAMKARGDYVGEVPATKVEEESDDILKNLGEATKWKLDFTTALREEFGCKTFWFDNMNSKDLHDMETIMLKRAVDQRYAQDLSKKRNQFKDDKGKSSDIFPPPTKKRLAIDYVNQQECPIPENIPYVYPGRRSIVSALKQINWGHSGGPFLYNKAE